MQHDNHYRRSASARKPLKQIEEGRQLIEGNDLNLNSLKHTLDTEWCSSERKLQIRTIVARNIGQSLLDPIHMSLVDIKSSH